MFRGSGFVVGAWAFATQRRRFYIYGYLQPDITRQEKTQWGRPGHLATTWTYLVLGEHNYSLKSESHKIIKS